VRITVRVPATSANLGPGFDCFGLALDLCNEVTVDTAAEPGVSWEGEGTDELPTDGTDMTSRAIAFTAERLSGSGTSPPIALRGVNRIPLASGLGSSAAATVAGVAIARALLGDHGRAGFDRSAIYVHAVAFEEHPDNVAAATMGGFTIAKGEDVYRFDPHPSLEPIVLLPRDVRLATGEARAALGPTVPRGDAVWNISNASLLSLAVVHHPDLIGHALEDRLHQSVRLELLSEVRSIAERLEEAGVPFCLSGAGPALLVFGREGASTPADLGPGWEVLRPRPNLTGVEIDVEE
jgi:homoserine kinase